MRIFDSSGYLIIPDPREKVRDRAKKVAIVEHCYCPNGDDIIWEYAQFNGFPGIRIFVEKENCEAGDIVLSPIFGDHTRVSLGVKLIHGEKLKLLCPICYAEFPVLKQCTCGKGELRVISLKKEFSFTDAIVVCDIVDCFNSYIIKAGEIITETMLESSG